MEYWRAELYHSAEGQTWKKHKYIRKEGDRYIYEENENQNGGSSSSGGVLGALKGVAKKVSNAASDTAKSVSNKVSEVASNASKAVKTTASKASEAASTAGKAIKTTAKNATNKASEVAKNATNKASEVAKSTRQLYSDSLKSIAATEAVQNAGKAIKEAPNKISEAASTAARNLSNAASKTAKGAKSIGEDIVRSTKNTAEEIGENAKIAAKNWSNAVSKATNGAISIGQDIARSTKNTVEEIGDNIRDNIHDTLGNAQRKATSAISDMTSKFKSAMDKRINEARKKKHAEPTETQEYCSSVVEDMKMFSDTHYRNAISDSIAKQLEKGKMPNITYPERDKAILESREYANNVYLNLLPKLEQGEEKTNIKNVMMTLRPDDLSSVTEAETKYGGKTKKAAELETQIYALEQNLYAEVMAAQGRVAWEYQNVQQRGYSLDDYYFGDPVEALDDIYGGLVKTYKNKDGTVGYDARINGGFGYDECLKQLSERNWSFQTDNVRDASTTARGKNYESFYTEMRQAQDTYDKLEDLKSQLADEINRNGEYGSKKITHVYIDDGVPYIGVEYQNVVTHSATTKLVVTPGRKNFL